MVAVKFIEIHVTPVVVKMALHQYEHLIIIISYPSWMTAAPVRYEYQGVLPADAGIPELLSQALQLSLGFIPLF